MAGGILCSVAGCGYVTRTKVDDDMAPALKIRVVRLQVMELQIHADSVHVFPPVCTPGTTAVQMSKSAKKKRRKKGYSSQTKVQCLQLPIQESQTQVDSVHVFPSVPCSKPAYVSRPLSLSWVKELAYNERFWNTEEVVFVCDKDNVRTSPATAAQMELFTEDTDEKDGSTRSSGVTSVTVKPKNYRNDDVPEERLHVSEDFTDTDGVDLTEQETAIDTTLVQPADREYVIAMEVTKLQDAHGAIGTVQMKAVGNMQEANGMVDMVVGGQTIKQPSIEVIDEAEVASQV